MVFTVIVHLILAVLGGVVATAIISLLANAIFGL